MSRARGWCFTLNNPAEGAQAVYEALECKYIIVGDEVGAEGTPHHQGYVCFANPIRFATVQARLPAGAHLEVARGSGAQNRTYCSKERILLERGEVPTQGKRTDIEEVREQLAAGCAMTEICDTARSFQAIRGAEMILKYRESVRSWLPEVHWFYGPTGSGKTRTAYELAPNAWMSGKNLKWWDGYDAHEDVIIDDFRGDFCTYHELLRILDRYPYRVEVKGGSRQLLARRFFITAPFHPRNAYQTLEDKAQLLRRISVIREFLPAGTEVAGTEVRG